MDIGGEGVSVYAEAKAEYTKQLCQYVVPPIQQYFLDLLEEAKQKEVESKRVLLMFQTLLEGISDWNVDKVQRETLAIVTASQCDYLEELMTAVFIAHTKVLSAIRLTTRQKKLQITIPKLEHFIHRTLTECARLLWSNTYLFSTSAPSMERQKNLRQIENFLHEGVLQGIRGMLPVKNILREYLKDDEEEDVEETVAEEPVAELAAEPVAEPVKEPVAEPVAEPVKEPVKEPVAEPVKEPVAEPIKELVETIVIDTQKRPTFTGDDTMDNTSEAQEEELFKDIEEVQILDTPPEAMDDFEELNDQDTILPMDFELL